MLLPPAGLPDQVAVQHAAGLVVGEPVAEPRPGGEQDVVGDLDAVAVADEQPGSVRASNVESTVPGADRSGRLASRSRARPGGGRCAVIADQGQAWNTSAATAARRSQAV